MNKKVFILPLAVAAMGLASCNKGVAHLSRHSLKEVDETTFLERCNTILKDESRSYDKNYNYQFDKSFSYKSVRAATTNEKTDGVYSEKDSYTSNYSGIYDKDSDSIKSISSSNSEDFDSKYFTNEEKYYKLKQLKDDSFQQFIYTNDKLAGAKEYTSDDVSGNSPTILNSSILGRCYTVYGSLPSILMGEPLGFCLTQDWGAGGQYKFNELYSRAKEKGMKIVLGSNDEKSISISISGTLDYKDYIYVFDYNNYDETVLKCEDFKGKVEYNNFVCIENNYVTQAEMTENYNDCSMKNKAEYTDNGEIHKQNPVTKYKNNKDYKNFEINFNSTEKVSFNANDFKWTSDDPVPEVK